MAFDTYLNTLALDALPLDFRWEPLDADLIWAATDEEQPRLVEALARIEVVPTYALGVACCEWVAARFASLTDTTDLRRRIEAAWAAVVDWRYARIVDVEPLPDDVPRQTARPVWFCSHLMSRAFVDYASDDAHANTRALIMLCDHVLGRHPAFEPWLSETMRRLAARFPQRGDGSLGSPLPRDAFDPAFGWDDAEVAAGLKRHIESLDPARNPYLRAPQVMLDKGFAGTPYRYPA